MSRRFWFYGWMGALLLVLSSCNVTKYVPDGSYLLDKVKVNVDNKTMSETEFSTYLRQRPNTKLFNSMNFNLGLYSISSKDTTQWINRFLQKIGDAPVIYDSLLTQSSAKELQKVMQNKGYAQATVTTTTTFKKKKAQVTYHITSKTPYRINQCKYRILDENIKNIVLADSSNTLIKAGALFDIDNLEKERNRIAKLLRQKGYLYFDKEYIGYVADTTIGNKRVNLSLLVRPMRKITSTNQIENVKHEPYYVRDVHYYLTQDIQDLTNDSIRKTLDVKNYKGLIVHANDKFARPSTIFNNTGVQGHSLYNEKNVEDTYARLSALGIFKYLNISFDEVADSLVVYQTQNVQDSLLYGIENNILSDTIRHKQVDCHIVVTPDKLQSFSFEIEGTNNEGDFGIAGKLGYSHNNIFKGGETFKIQLRGANESLIQGRSIWDIGTEASLKFPTFLFPGVKKKFIWDNTANSEIYVNFSYQIRKEYTRMIAGAGLRYNWQSPKKVGHHIDLIDFSYVYLPTVSDEFKQTIEESLLKYSYEDHMIMRAGYGVSYSDRHLRRNRSYNSVRAAFEMGGNLLYGICAAANASKDENGSYLLGNIPFSQYVKIDASYSYNQIINEKNSIVYHIGAGIGIPYANSNILPFEKRYYGGGANSVRGWSARSLGPGAYNAGGSIDYMKQSGDINLNLNIEYRTKLVWMLELALFLDGGNIWTLADEGQPGGQFKWNQFYEQIAFGYGIGLRLNFDFFVIRLDWGIKAFDPAAGPGEHWRFTPSWDILRDTALHFAVGYPF